MAHIIRIAVCDDEITSLETLYLLIREYLEKHSKDEFLIRRFHSIYDLLECVENPNLHFNIYFLDVMMPVYSGIEVGRMIRENDEYAVIVYVTATSEFAIDASATEPLQYMLKPIDPAKLADVLDSACRKLERAASKNLLVKRKDGLANIALHQIEYVEYRDHALTFYLHDGRSINSRIVRESFSSIVGEKLSDPRFIKPHAAFVVNMDRVAALSAKGFEMDSGMIVPVSKREYVEVKRQFTEYMVKQNGSFTL